MATKVATVEEKRPIWNGWGLVSIRLSSRLGQRTYKNEDGICAFLPVLHIFVVQLLGTGRIHIEDGSGRVTVTGPARSHGDAMGRHDGNVEIADQAVKVRIYTYAKRSALAMWCLGSFPVMGL